MALKIKGVKTVNDNLNKWMEDRLRGIEDFNRVIASEAQTYARTNARWENITGDARKGLTGSTNRERTKFFINLFHKVIYGKWLELKDDGKFAIIEESLNKLRLKWFQGVRRLLNRSTRI